MEPVRTAVITHASPVSVGLRYGLLIGLVSVMVAFGSFSLQLQENWGVRLLSIAILVLGVVLAQREFKKQNAGFMSYGQGLGVALVAGCVVGVLSAVFIYVYITFISPEFQQLLLDKAREGMEAKGVADEQIDQAVAMTGRFMMPIMVGSALFGAVLQALIIGLISSAFVKNAQPDFE